MKKSVMAAKLNKSGLKATPQRLAVLNLLGEFSSEGFHPSAEDIYSRLHPELPALSFATVYKTLASLTAAGFIAELGLNEKRLRYDGNCSAHAHLICTDCGSITDIFGVPAIEVDSEQAAGFEIERTSVSFYGKCENCKE